MSSDIHASPLSLQSPASWMISVSSFHLSLSWAIICIYTLHLFQTINVFTFMVTIVSRPLWQKRNSTLCAVPEHVIYAISVWQWDTANIYCFYTSKVHTLRTKSIRFIIIKKCLEDHIQFNLKRNKKPVFRVYTNTTSLCAVWEYYIYVLSVRL